MAQIVPIAGVIRTMSAPNINRAVLDRQAERGNFALAAKSEFRHDAGRGGFAQPGITRIVSPGATRASLLMKASGERESRATCEDVPPEEPAAPIGDCWMTQCEKK